MHGSQNETAKRIHSEYKVNVNIVSLLQSGAKEEYLSFTYTLEYQSI
jgi:hypothetical protein